MHEASSDFSWLGSLLFVSSSAMMLLVGSQEGHLAFKMPVPLIGSSIPEHLEEEERGGTS